MKEKIVTYFDQALRANKFAGSNIIVRKDGQEIIYYENGFQNKEKNIPIRKNTIFRLASMTKPVIAVAVLILFDRGMLDLDDPIDKYLSEFKEMKVADHFVGFTDVYEADPENPMVPKFRIDKLDNIAVLPLKKKITIRHILGHASGMGHGPYSNSIYEQGVKQGQTLEERVKWIAQVPLDFVPGEYTGYSAGVAFDVLGRIIEVVSGMNLNDFIQKNICEPLQIKDMGYCLNDEQISRLAEIYEAKDGEIKNVTKTDEPWKRVNPLADGYFSGSAGMFASIEAYDSFVMMLANMGSLNGVEILKSETVQKIAMNSSDIGLQMSPGIGWGLGMIVHENPEESGRKVSKGTFGWSGAYGTHFFVDPVRKITAVMMMSVSNIGGADSPIARDCEELMFEI